MGDLLGQTQKLGCFCVTTVAHWIPENNLFMQGSVLCLPTGADDPGFSRTPSAVIPTANHAT